MRESEKDRHFLQSNKELWNKKTAIHKSSDFYDLEGFKRGKNMLNNIELAELGDVTGKRILHLQCHFGLDTMSFSRLGAEVTGIDFSEEAIRTAREINHELGLKTEFICTDIYDLENHLDQEYDIVFTSYGVIGWLPDLNKWAKIVSRFLKKDGTFYMAEFHPFVWMLDDDFKHIHYSYFNQGVLEIDVETTYADRKAELNHKEYSWNHSISEVINALISQNLEIRSFNEFDYSPYDCFPNTVKNEEGNYYIQGFEKILPIVYSIRCINKS